MSDVFSQFDWSTLRDICAMPETSFARAFDMDTVTVPQSAPDNFYLHCDNGSSVLAVAHLDTVARHESRGAKLCKTQAGLVVHSRALDDRLGAFTILDLLPRLGVTFDWLLTTGEETGRSTASFFEPQKDYDWVIEFDRGGTDVVMYQFDDANTRAAVRATGATVGDGIFSDICYLEHLGIKAFNWGIGYQDYHGPRAHAYLDDTFDMIDYFLSFHATNYGVYMPHEKTRGGAWWGSVSDTDEDAEYKDCPECKSNESVAENYCLACGFCFDCNSRGSDCLCYPSPVTPSVSTLSSPKGL